ncbi:hypothetical protein GGI04_004402 [Coemansia thaxteri]|uniref:Uncharacterized protein n=1 Tax=Coemansia thaxteri TaxID=2663907 RepID=A0A9W8BKA9_9FUNG|nr:hypothetical protein GGI04_004402 [Coemansia thaxteri]KAJ2004271.1 hypothetical protein H4R26_002606 [Coemansia thaxteri]KAJ2328236.1 hypothetical protein GGH92_009903 [Coemansia sp. RSA 2673]KAJ2462928.1 hypothetical protein EV174_007038 [Coemansia sp. RSA 2320]KAJ2467516.1 hypothetical protein GGI02_004009 [Coemansia sp. RSA 2322]
MTFKIYSLALGALALAAAAAAAPQPMSGLELYEGMHLPPAMRRGAHRHDAQMHRRDIPYGGFLTFGNMPLPTMAVAAPLQQPCAGDASARSATAARRRKPLLGLIDVDLDLHL